MPGLHDMPAEEFRRFGHEVIDWIADYLHEPRDHPIAPPVSPGDLKSQLPKSAPEQGQSMEEILADFRQLILPHSVIWNHPRFHGYFSVSSSGTFSTASTEAPVRW